MSTAAAPDYETDARALQRKASRRLAAPRLEGYEVLELIGSGTYGDVWRARETNTQITVAIKRLRQQPEGFAADEPDKLAQLSAARGIVSLRKVHLHAEPYCYVMEYMTGGSLADEISRGPLPFRRAWDKFKQIAGALAFVHKDTIVHCDLKPANILSDALGNPRIADFGQSRAQGADGAPLGTRFYMPPEQARQGVPDTNWDVYALGAILYEMLTGKRPRYDASIDERLGSPSASGSDARRHLEEYARHLDGCPRPAAHRSVKGVDASIARLIDRCLDVNCDDRPRDASAVESMIQECEREARMRKIMRFGGWAPALMLLVLGLAALIAGYIVNHGIEQAWITSLNDRNAALADALTASIASRFNLQLKIGQEEAESQKLIDLLRSNLGPNDGNEWNEYTDKARDTLESLFEKYHVTGQSTQIDAWSVTRNDGISIGNFGDLGNGKYDSDKKSIGDNFSHREWFNGEIERKKEDAEPNRPTDIASMMARRRTEARVAHPIIRMNEPRIALIPVSCPIAEADSAAPLGILLSRISYVDVHRDVTKLFPKAKGRDVVILQRANGGDSWEEVYTHNLGMAMASDEKPQDEGLFTDFDEYDPGGNTLFQKILKASDDEAWDTTNDPVEATTATDLTWPTDAYEDPRDEKRLCLGVMRRFKLDNEQRFAVIVQQEYSPALAPLRPIKLLAEVAIAALIVIGFLCLGLNVLAIRREAAAHV